jgi:hypothetical protein
LILKGKLFLILFLVPLREREGERGHRGIGKGSKRVLYTPYSKPFATDRHIDIYNKNYI